MAGHAKVKRDKRHAAVVDGIVQQREPLRRVETVYAPTLRGVSAVLRGEGLDEYARRLDEMAQQIASICRDTRLLVEQLDTLTDPRLEDTDPRFPAPPNPPKDPT